MMIELKLLHLIETQNNAIKDLSSRIEFLEKNNADKNNLLPLLQAIVDELDMLSYDTYNWDTSKMDEVKRQLDLLYEHTDEE